MKYQVVFSDFARLSLRYWKQVYIIAILSRLKTELTVTKNCCYSY